MSNIDKAFTVPGLSLDDVVGIFYGTVDPSVSGFDAPEGSLYLRYPQGELYQKTAAGVDQWTMKAASAINALNDIGDVNVPNPQDREFLRYDADNQEWIAGNPQRTIDGGRADTLYYAISIDGGDSTT